MSIADASFLTRMNLAINALKALGVDPKNEAEATTLNASLDAKRYHRLVEVLRSSEEGRALLTKRPSLQGPEVPLAELEALPSGSLGFEFAAYFKRNGISPFHTTARIDSDFDFIGKRYRETHDLFHVLTGYSTDLMGEMELQAFVLGNLRLPSTLLILVFTMAPLVKEGPGTFAGHLRRLRRAYVRGRKTRELLSVSYEQFWATPVSAVVQQLAMPAA
jgi:ubiquinone biosynthesis protein COQ4